MMTMVTENECWQDVCRLASLLRESGDRVLSGNSKLRLTPILLMKLNAAFMRVSVVGSSNDFQVTSAHASQPLSISQLHFLHDFVQKTVGLTISGSPIILRQDFYAVESLDLSRFRSLRHLELRNCIPVNASASSHVLKGLATLKPQLETLVLMHIVNVQDLLWIIFANEAVDIKPGIMWPRLSQLVVSYCGLRSLGAGLSLANNLQWLDASHNMLSDCEEVARCLGALPKLRYLNLSFNRLKGIPVPCYDSTHIAPAHLQFLLLSHNYVDNLNGIDCLTGLVELNLAVNQLQDYTRLHPLRSLFQLQHLKLEGNPISFHKRHRVLVAPYISPRAVFLKHRGTRYSSNSCSFLLDGVQLSDLELEAVRSSPVSSSFCIENDMNASSSVMSSSGSGVQTTSHGKETKSRAIRKVRHVVIADLENETEHSSALKASSGSLESSQEHLRTKQQLNNVRKKFGQDWLRGQAQSAVQEVLGLPTTQGLKDNTVNSLSTPQPLSSSTPLVSPGASVTTPYTGHLDIESMENLVFDIKPVSLTTYNSTDRHKALGNSTTLNVNSSQSTQYNTANESDSVLQITADTLNGSHSVQLSESSQEVNTSEGTYINEEDSNIIAEGDGDDDDDNDDDHSGSGDHSKFLVQEVKGQDLLGDVFLIVSPRYIKEISSSTGLRRQKWILETLQSCVMIRVNPCHVQLSFNTVVQSKRERVYQMDLSEAQQLISMLQHILEARSLSAMNFAAFRCMNCSGEFSADLKSKKGSRRCPTCGSVLVFELDEAPLPSLASEVPLKPQVSDLKGTNETPEINSSLVHSPSGSSIECAGVSAQASRARLQVCADVHLPPSVTLPRSAASLESPITATQQNSSATTNLRRCESDIDIISNPSQSSIEVLDDINRTCGTPGRKRSSEERQVVAVPSLHPVPECSSTLASVPAGLTESSSSGSLTDSVCTAYENNSGTNVNLTSHRVLHGLANTALKEETSRENSPHCEDASEETEFSQPTSLSNVLDGLLQTMSSKLSAKEGTERRAIIKKSASENFIQYNYTDFSTIDHRLKLHLCLSVLDADEREVIQILLRAEVFTSSGTRYPGLLIITSQRVYVIKITGPEEGDCVERWFSRVVAVPCRNIQCISALPWDMGILLSLQGSSNVQFMFVLRDQQYVDNLFSFLNNVPHNSTWSVERVPPQERSLLINKVLVNLALESSPSTSNPSLNLVVLICRSIVEQQEEKKTNEGGLFAVASNGLFLCNDDLTWLLLSENLSSDNMLFKCLANQLISNLIEVDSHGLDLSFHFLDEVGGGEEIWKLSVQSESVHGQIISALSSPWEELFSIPLQVTYT